MKGGRAKARSVAWVCDGCGRELVRRLDTTDTATCPCGGATLAAPPDDGHLTRCLRCGLDSLYVQKDFNKKTGLWLFVIAAVLSVPTWGLSLVVATCVDLLLYWLLDSATLCYGCGAVHRGFPANPDHGPFDIHVQEAVDRGLRTA